jgi:hypothetical protein
MNNGTKVNEDGLRKGDVVVIRSPAEILQTLDATGAINSMPFMPEMVEYCGRRFTVAARADKLCDTITQSGSRRLENSVLLSETRCNGSGHNGCQADCLLYWNEAWLRKVDPTSAVEPMTAGDPAARAALLDLVSRNTRKSIGEPTECYRCQATEMIAATVKLSTADPRPYLREYTSGNVTAGTFARVMARAAVMQPLHHLGLLTVVPVKGRTSKSPTAPPLNLKPGEWVRVKSREQIAEMVTDKGTNRGLWFDREMLPFCGKVYRVRQRVGRIIDDRNGKMLEFGNECVSLEGVVCSGERSTSRWFCPRAIFPYWRESWLERVDAPSA